MKTILIDGFNLGLEKGTGVATYARNLSYQIHAMGHEISVLYGNRTSTSADPLLREVTFFDQGYKPRSRVLEQLRIAGNALRGPRRHVAAPIPVTGKVVQRTFAARLPYFDRIFNAQNIFQRAQHAFHLWGGLSDVAIEPGPDLAHWTYPIPLRMKKIPNIYTMHDLVPLRLPYTTLDIKEKYLNLIRKLGETADHIVTVSECSKRDIIEIIGIPEHRITNTYQAVEIPQKYLEKDEEQVANEIVGFAGLEYKNYYLFWGSIEPKKNIGRMIEAYLSSRTAAPLVIVGAQAWKSKEEMRILEGGNGIAGDRIKQLSYVPFSVLVSLIRGARGALFPSLYEGFGLPALEAMLLGTPVICSNTSSLPEVVGEAALMVDPYDTAAIADAIRTIDHDADLRAELSARGVVQAAKYSPEAYRARLGELYARLL